MSPQGGLNLPRLALHTAVLTSSCQQCVPCSGGLPPQVILAFLIGMGADEPLRFRLLAVHQFANTGAMQCSSLTGFGKTGIAAGTDVPDPKCGVQ